MGNNASHPLNRLLARAILPKENPMHINIDNIDRLQREEEERKQALQSAREEADRRAREAEAEAQRAREAHAAMQAAQAEAERMKREAEEARRRAGEAEAEAERVRRDAAEARLRAAEGEAERSRREADEARARAAEAERQEAQRRERELREEARKAAEEAQRQQQLAAEEKRRAEEAQRAAECAVQAAEEEARRAQEAKEEAERQLREGIRPVIMPSPADLEDARRKIGYRDGLYHFAVTGVPGSGKSSLINALRGLRNRDRNAARTGVAETTLQMERFPDPDTKKPFVWYDLPGAGTLAVRDWKYFHDQGLYVFDALVVLFDNRFTEMDVAILRNARLFGIPCYILRSKADVHVENLVKEMCGDDDEDGEQDEETREKVESEAREEFVSVTRKTVRDNLRAAELPDQRVYIVSNSTMLSVVKRSMTAKVSKKLLDEVEFLEDFLRDAYKRRGGSESKTVSAKVSRKVV